MKLSGCTGQPGTLTIGQARLRSPVPAEIIGQAHGAGRIALHGVDAAVGGAGAGGDDRQRLGREAIDPFAGGDGLAGFWDRCPARPSSPRVLIFSLGIEPSMTSTNGSSSPSLGLVPVLHEVVADFVGEHRVVQVDLGQAGDGAQDDILDARLASRR